MGALEASSIADSGLLSHSALVRLGRRWLTNPYRNAASNGHSACSVVLTELKTAAVEIPDAIGWTSDRSLVIEAKISRGDFLADLYKPWRATPGAGMGDLRYYLCPEGLILVEEVPEEWGLLYTDGVSVVVVKEASRMSAKNWRGEMTMLVSHARRSK